MHGTITSPNSGLPAAFSRVKSPAKDGSALAAGVLYVDQLGRGLFLKRNSGDHFGTWGLTFGGVDGDEDFDAAARRESREETGHDPASLTPLYRTGGEDGLDAVTFVSKGDSFAPVLNDEHSGYVWADLKDPPQPLHPGVAAVLERFFQEEAAEPEHAESGAAEKIAKTLEAKDACATDAALVLAVDRESVREFDKDRRLHVARTNISKANICPYRGAEIPGWQELGLDPDKVYRLLRDPGELKKAAPTFNRIPVLRDHVPVSAEDHQPMEVVGTTGSDADFSEPYLTNSLSLWAQDAIDDVESKTKAELSAGYHYRPDMTPGNFDGMPYDGVMRDIVGNHIAIVETGRAGPDVVVADSMESLTMSNPTRIAALALNLALRAVRPMLAMDQKINLFPLFRDLTTKNIAERKPVILAGVRAALKGKTIAADAQIDHLDELLTRLEKKPPADGDESVSQEQHNAMAAAANGESNLGIPEKVGQEFVDADKGKTFDEGAFREMLAGKGMGEDDINEIMGALPKSEAPAKDANPDDDDEDVKKPAGKDKDDEDDKKGDKPMGKDEMNAAIAAAVGAERRRGQEVRVALDEVRPHVGDLPVSIAFDSAVGVYKHALAILGVPEAQETNDPAALRAILRVQPRTGGGRPAVKPAKIAADKAQTKSFDEFYPGASRIGVA